MHTIDLQSHVKFSPDWVDKGGPKIKIWLNLRFIAPQRQHSASIWHKRIHLRLTSPRQILLDRRNGVGMGQLGISWFWQFYEYNCLVWAYANKYFTDYMRFNATIVC